MTILSLNRLCALLSSVGKVVYILYTYVCSRQMASIVKKLCIFFIVSNLIVHSILFPQKKHLAKIMNNFAKSAKKKESIFLPLFLLFWRKRACATTFWALDASKVTYPIFYFFFPQTKHTLNDNNNTIYYYLRDRGSEAGHSRQKMGVPQNEATLVTWIRNVLQRIFGL